MWYVIQIIHGREDAMARLIRKVVPADVFVTGMLAPFLQNGDVNKAQRSKSLAGRSKTSNILFKLKRRLRQKLPLRAGVF